MLFLGTTFMGFKGSTLPSTTSINNIDYIQLTNGLFSKAYATKDVTSELTNEISEDWDWDTILYANYENETTNAGNINWTVETISDLAVKKRIKGNFDWQIIEVKHIETEDDFNFVGEDSYTKSSTEYEYALVPYLNDDPGAYIIKDVYSDFEGIYIIGADQSFNTIATDGYIDTTRNISGNSNVPIHSRYPSYFSYGDMNYDSGSCSGKFFDTLDDGCHIDITDKGYLYKLRLMDFLTDKRPKILKHSDGRIWLIQVMPSPTDTAEGTSKIRNISFDWIQIGEYDNCEHLHDAGLLELDEKWWA